MDAQLIDEATEAVGSALACATDAKKCHQCGCFQDAVRTLEETTLAESLADVLGDARATFRPQKYDCLGCEVCWPADAINLAEEVVDLPTTAGCPATPADRREGWPPLPGDFEVVRYAAPVAVCTLHSRDLVRALAEACPAGLSIVGCMQTENLGIERVIENVIANPHIRVLLLCGDDTAGRIGHFPGQSLLALVENGVDDRGRIVGATGRRPVLKNVSAAAVRHFRDQVCVLDHRGKRDVAALADIVGAAASDAPGPAVPPDFTPDPVERIAARSPEPLVLDPAGYVVVTPDRRRDVLVAEHYHNQGVLGVVVEGTRAVDVMATLLSQGLVTRMDHAAYLGRELALAEQALAEGGLYVQDRAPDVDAAGTSACCAEACGGQS